MNLDFLCLGARHKTLTNEKNAKVDEFVFIVKKNYFFMRVI